MATPHKLRAVNRDALLAHLQDCRQMRGFKVVDGREGVERAIKQQAMREKEGELVSHGAKAVMDHLRSKLHDTWRARGGKPRELGLDSLEGLSQLTRPPATESCGSFVRYDIKLPDTSDLVAASTDGQAAAITAAAGVASAAVVAASTAAVAKIPVDGTALGGCAVAAAGGPAERAAAGSAGTSPSAAGAANGLQSHRQPSLQQFRARGAATAGLERGPGIASAPAGCLAALTMGAAMLEALPWPRADIPFQGVEAVRWRQGLRGQFNSSFAWRQQHLNKEHAGDQPVPAPKSGLHERQSKQVGGAAAAVLLWG